MHRKRDTRDWRWHEFPMRVAADDRDVALVEPSRAAHMHSRRGNLGVPWSFLGAVGPPPGPHKYDVPGRDADARILLPGVQVGRIDRSREIQIFNPL